MTVVVKHLSLYVCVWHYGIILKHLAVRKNPRVTITSAWWKKVHPKALNPSSHATLSRCGENRYAHGIRQNVCRDHINTVQSHAAFGSITPPFLLVELSIACPRRLSSLAFLCGSTTSTIYFCSSLDHPHSPPFFVTFVWGRCVLFCRLPLYCRSNCGSEPVVSCPEVHGVWCRRRWFHARGVARTACVLCCPRSRSTVAVLWCLPCWIGTGRDETCVFVCFSLLSLLFASLSIVCEWLRFGPVDMSLEIRRSTLGFGIPVDLTWWSVSGGRTPLGSNWSMSGSEKSGTIPVGSVHLDMWSGDELGGCWSLHLRTRFLTSNVVVVRGPLAQKPVVFCWRWTWTVSDVGVDFASSAVAEDSCTTSGLTYKSCSVLCV